MYTSQVPPNRNSSILETRVPNVLLIQPTFRSTPSNLNANFERPKNPDPQPTTFFTAILSFCPLNTSTCFGCRRSLREGKDLCFITKSRGPIGRYDNGIMQYTTDLKNVYFRVTEDCVRPVFPNFVACFFPLYQPHRQLLSSQQSNSLMQLFIHF